MKCTITLETESPDGVLQRVNDMMNIDEYKRAIHDFKTSIESMYEETDDAYEMADELEKFVETEMKEILNGLNLD